LFQLLGKLAVAGIGITIFDGLKDAFRRSTGLGLAQRGGPLGAAGGAGLGLNRYGELGNAYPSSDY
jgi:hypothetical protein